VALDTYIRTHNARGAALLCNLQTVVISCSLKLITSKHTLQMPTKEKPKFQGTEYSIKFQNHNEQPKNISPLLQLLGIFNL
jgi:hypothetical protein